MAETTEEKHRRRQQIEQAARELGVVLAQAVPPDHGFLLVLHDDNQAGSLTIVSSASRADSIALVERVLQQMKSEQS